MPLRKPKVKQMPDHEARERATRAIALIESHERGCVERERTREEWRSSVNHSLSRIEIGVAAQFKSISDAAAANTDNINRQLAGVYVRVWWGVGGIIGAMFTLIMILVGPHLK